MAQKRKLKKDGDKIPHKSNSTARDRVRQHITNIDDVITDEDIRNAGIDTTEIKQDINKKESELKKNAKVNEGSEAEGKKKITPWDVIDE